ncbi:hypothetical protein DYB25_010234 [Aphanomyces astaci]|uniref:Uncharacterized protein n=1 Tax=Aphanomyces astaci TaxID=112090 RepID=A0A397B9S7_APHAT|nr:hypothetical protein DYB25_010234 [Aphanomyces astaci]
MRPEIEDLVFEDVNDAAMSGVKDQFVLTDCEEPPAVSQAAKLTRVTVKAESVQEELKATRVAREEQTLRASQEREAAVVRERIAWTQSLQAGQYHFSEGRPSIKRSAAMIHLGKDPDIVTNAEWMAYFQYALDDHGPDFGDLEAKIKTSVVMNDK